MTSAACIGFDGGTVQCACMGMPATCDDYFSGATDVARCTWDTPCLRRIDGVPCCTRVAWCEGGGVVEGIDCTDDCDQRCERIGVADDCEAFRCRWTDAGCER
jgi:hypothetical protein